MKRGILFCFLICCIASLCKVDARDDIQLKFVQLVTRHGARTPFYSIPNNEPEWDCTLTELSIPNLDSDNLASIPRVYRKNYLPNRESFKGNCATGQLTSEGYDNHIQLGKRLRQYYVDQLKFLPAQYDVEQIYVRTTDSPRTIQSAQANLLGLYPPSNRPSSSQVIDFWTIDSATEDLVPSPVCPHLVGTCDAIQETSEWKAMMTKYEPLKLKLEHMWNSTNLPWWVGIWDNLYARKFHDLPLPTGVTEELYTTLADFALWQLKTLYANHEVRKLGIGRFVSELVGAMNRSIEGQASPKYIYYSAHDVTVGLLLSAFNEFEGVKEWPPFAANILFELHQDSQNNYYVRMIYNGFALPMPACDSVDGDNTLCDYRTFVRIANSVIPDNYDKECQSTGIFRPFGGKLGATVASQYLC